MAGGSSLLTESSWSGEQLPNQNNDKGKARDLPIRDHVSQLTICDDGKERHVLSSCYYMCTHSSTSDLFVTASV